MREFCLYVFQLKKKKLQSQDSKEERAKFRRHIKRLKEVRKEMSRKRNEAEEM